MIQIDQQAGATTQRAQRAQRNENTAGHRIVIVGGGVGGLGLATRLSASLGRAGLARIVLPLADLSAISVIPAIAYHSGGTKYGAAFELLYDTIADDVGRLKANGDQVYRPAVFFLSDGRPSDRQQWHAPHQRVTDPDWPMHPNILAFGFGKAAPVILQQVATVRAFIADQGTGPGAALRELATSLIQSIVTSGSRPASGGALTLAVPDTVPGFTALPADRI